MCLNQNITDNKKSSFYFVADMHTYIISFIYIIHTYLYFAQLKGLWPIGENKSDVK